MNSIDIKSLLIGALFTAVVFLSTGWQRSVVGGTQKVTIATGTPINVNIVKWPDLKWPAFGTLKIKEEDF